MNGNAFQRWNSDLANVIAHVGDSIFFQQVFAAIEAQVPVAYPQAWLYHKDLPPQLLDHKIPKDAYGSQVDEYLEGPYREDPFFKISLSAPAITAIASRGWSPVTLSRAVTIAIIMRIQAPSTRRLLSHALPMAALSISA